MQAAIHQYYQSQPAPIRVTLLALRDLILAQHPDLKEDWKYGMPFFVLRKKMFCYLWVHKTLGLPYIGLVDGKLIDHPALLQEKRARMKILLVNPAEEWDLGEIQEVLRMALKLRMG